MNAGRKKAESGRRHVAAEEERCQNLTDKSQPCDDTQVNRRKIHRFKM